MKVQLFTDPEGPDVQLMVSLPRRLLQDMATEVHILRLIGQLDPHAALVVAGMHVLRALQHSGTLEGEKGGIT